MEVGTGRCLKNNQVQALFFTDVESETREQKGLAQGYRAGLWTQVSWCRASGSLLHQDGWKTEASLKFCTESAPEEGD